MTLMTCDNLSEGVGFSDESKLEPIADFDWESVEAELDEITNHENAHRYSDYLRLMKLGEALSRWLFIDGAHTNPDGVVIRAAVLEWIFLKELQSRSLTEIALRIGKDKQSVGRWVDDFKKRFPGVTNSHMKFKK